MHVSELAPSLLLLSERRVQIHTDGRLLSQFCAVAFPLWRLADDGAEEDRAVLLSGAQVEGHHVLPRRDCARVIRLGVHRHHGRRLGISQPLWRFFSDCIVRAPLSPARPPAPACKKNRSAPLCGRSARTGSESHALSSFLPFWRRGVMRNLPVIGNFLSLRPVRAVTDRLITKSRLPL